MPTLIDGKEVTSHSWDFAVIGGGPTGMSCAAAFQAAGLSSVILEKGVLCNSIYNYPEETVFFTDRDSLAIAGVPFPCPDVKPNRLQALYYYRSVARKLDLNLLQHSEVTRIDGEEGSFTLHVDNDDHPEISAKRIVNATGYYDNPNYLNVPGEELDHVSHYYESAHLNFQHDVLIVGGQNSACRAALDFYRNEANVTLVHRGAALGDSVKYWVKPDMQNRIDEGSVDAYFETVVERITEDRVYLKRRDSELIILPIDKVFLLTGYHPDPSLLRTAGVEFDDETLVPEYDEQSLESNVDGVFLAGSIIAGKDTNEIFIENGRFHGERIVDALRKRGELSDIKSGDAKAPTGAVTT